MFFFKFAAQVRTPSFPVRDLMATHAIAGYLRLPRLTTGACTKGGVALAMLLSGRTRVRHWQAALRLWPDTRREQLPLDDCCRLVLPYNAVHSIQQTQQIPNDPPRMGAKSTTTSHHPSRPTPILDMHARPK